MPGKRFISVIGPLFLVVIPLLIISCGGVSTQIRSHEFSHYDCLNNDSFWANLRPELGAEDIVVIEAHGDNFCVLQKRYRRSERAIDDINFAGYIFYHDPSTDPNTVSLHRLLGASSDQNLFKNITAVKRRLRQLQRLEAGLVVVIESLAKATDAQIEKLAALPIRCLVIPRLDYLTIDQAEKLAKFAGASICLPGLLWIGAGHARHLANFEGDYLNLSGLRMLKEEDILALCQFRGREIFLGSLYDEPKELVKSYLHQAQASLITESR